MTAAQPALSPLAIVAVALLAACSQGGGGATQERTTTTGATSPATSSSSASQGNGDGTQAAAALGDGQAEAIFAGGCFWCVESAFEDLPGVVSVTSGYTGGALTNPTYRQVGTQETGHYEAVRIVFDPTRTSYEALLEVFWHNIDPTQADGQFCDRGASYRSAVFVKNAEERRLANETRSRAAEHLDDDVVTEILDAMTFWVAEDYHQDYYRTHPENYQRYRRGCGRDRRLGELWGESAGH